MSINSRTRAEALLKLAKNVARDKSLEAGVRCVREALVLEPNFVEAWWLLGDLQANGGKGAERIESYRSAANCVPLKFEAVYRYGDLLQRAHRLNELASLLDDYKESIETEPYIGFLQALFLWRTSSSNDALAKLDRILNLDVDLDLKSRMYWLRGTLLNEQACYDEAFDSFYRMNALEKERIDEGENLFEIQLSNLEARGAELALGGESKETPMDTTQPILLCGFPRSGTTLMGSMLNANSALIVRDEWGTMESVFRLLKRKGYRFPEDIDLVDKDTLEELRHRFLITLDVDPSVRFVDKMPFQLLHLELIWKLFPGAPVVVMIRNPYDVCLSCFFQRFSLNSAMRNFVSLEKTVELYDRTMQLLRRYKNVLHGPMLCVRYEDVVKNAEEKTREIGAFLSVEWTPDMLDFHIKAREAQDVRTPSYHQIVKPLYGSSVERWRSYAIHLAPHADRLNRWCKEFGYDVLETGSI